MEGGCGGFLMSCCNRPNQVGHKTIVKQVGPKESSFRPSFDGFCQQYSEILASNLADFSYLKKSKIVFSPGVGFNILYKTVF